MNSNYAKQLLIKHLIEQKYGSYARKLIEIDKFIVADIYNGMPCKTAFMVPDESTICVNPGFFELSDPNDLDEQKEMLDQLSVIVRHELLHYLLSHEVRFVAYLKKKYPHSWGREYSNPKMHTLANMAMDWDLCNEAYTQEDKQIVQHMKLNGEFICGLVTEENVKNDSTAVWFDDGTEEIFSGSQFNGWENKTMEDMWQMLHDAHNVYINKSPADFGDKTETQPGHSETHKRKNGSAEYNAMYDRIIAKFGQGKISKAEIMELAGRLNANRTDGEDFDIDKWHFDYSESLKRND